MVAHRRADRCRHWNSHGVYRQWIRDPKILVASSRDCDLRPDHCLRDHPGRAELDPSRDYVARDHQRNSVWWRIGLVLLFQAKRNRLFLRTEEPMIHCVCRCRASAPLAMGFGRRRACPTISLRDQLIDQSRQSNRSWLAHPLRCELRKRRFFWVHFDQFAIAGDGVQRPIDDVPKRGSCTNDKRKITSAFVQEIFDSLNFPERQLLAKPNHARPHESATLGTFRQTGHVSIALVAAEITVRATGDKDVAMIWTMFSLARVFPSHSARSCRSSTFCVTSRNAH